MKNKEKDFDAVKMMREIREKLREKYETNPGLRAKRLKGIHKKYGLKSVEKKYSSSFSHAEHPSNRQRSY